jgi:hypothetical protein
MPRPAAHATYAAAARAATPSPTSIQMRRPGRFGAVARSNESLGKNLLADTPAPDVLGDALAGIRV